MYVRLSVCVCSNMCLHVDVCLYVCACLYVYVNEVSLAAGEDAEYKPLLTDWGEQQ